MSKVKVLIVEDEVIIADNIVNTLEDFGYEVLPPVTSYQEALDLIESEHPDIAILDIQLSGQKSGVDLATEINQVFKFPFIFLTSNSDKLTLEQAKKVEPLAFLVKPFNKKELYTSIELALYNYSKRRENLLNQENLIIKDALFIKSNKTFTRLDFSEILFLRSDHIYIEIHTARKQKHVVRGSLNEYINKLSRSFYRSHRSHIVNLDHLQEIKASTLLLKNTSKELPIGKRQRDELTSRLNKG
ncbi:MAG: response regulator [Bacteroidia bacterium]